MANISADGKRLIENGQELEKICNESSILIDELYEKLSSINKRCWVSPAADRFVSNIKSDHLQNKIVMNNLKEYARFITGAGTKIDEITRKWS